MADELVPTGDQIGGDASSTDSSIQLTTDPGGASEVGELLAGQVATDQAAQPTELETLLGSIPESDDDLASLQATQALEIVKSQRGQLRTLGKTVKDLQPLTIYQEFGNPEAVKTRLNIARLLYSPQLGPDRKPIIDPLTKTSHVTTTPLIAYLEKNSPGIIEQLLVDLLAYPAEVVGPNGQVHLDNSGNPLRAPMVDAVFAFYGIDRRRLNEYRQIDTLIAKNTGAVTPEELAEIPAEYHAAYRTIPPSVRAGWKALDEGDQTRLLEDYKSKLDDAARRVEDQKAAALAKRKEEQDYQLQVARAQDAYLDTVRRERTANLIQSLAKQVSFSTDANKNKVMLGALTATVAQLLDPAWRFLVEEEILAPLGIKLDSTFNTALDLFESAALESVALEQTGERDRAIDVRDKSEGAANQVMLKLWPVAIALAKAQGATVSAKAAAVDGALAAANTGRQQVRTTTPSGNPNNPYLPAGVRPGTREAVEYLARQSGYVQSSN